MTENATAHLGIKPLALGSTVLVCLAGFLLVWGPQFRWAVALVLGLFAVGGACFVVAVGLWTSRIVTNALSARLEVLYRQTEALMHIHGRVRFEATPPALRGWPVSPDFAVLAMRQLEDLHERGAKLVVLECGSGASTIILGTLLREFGRGRLVSLESDKDCFEETRRNVLLHGLREWVEVHHAPLVSHELYGVQYLWYDVTKLELPGKINLVIVDGPRGDIARLARFPAVPVLHPWMEYGCRVLVDDASRIDEREMIKRWLKLALVEKAETFATEKGAALVRGRPSGTATGVDERG